MQDTIVYGLVPKDPETSFFFLHPATGVITLAKRLTVEDDAERQTEYRVILSHYYLLI